MSRGGYVSMSKCLDKLVKIIGSREKAKHKIIDNLVSGAIESRGFKMIGYEKSSDHYESEENINNHYQEEDLHQYEMAFYDKEGNKIDYEKIIILKNLAYSSYFDKVKYDKNLNQIEKSVWKNTSKSDPSHWDWHEGYVILSCGKKVKQFTGVSFRESDFNKLCKLLDPQSPSLPNPPTPRKKGTNWNDWAAALATLAFEHQITGEMQVKDLDGLITARLEKWGIERMPPSTVAPTIKNVLDKFAQYPPTKPLHNVE